MKKRVGYAASWQYEVPITWSAQTMPLGQLSGRSSSPVQSMRQRPSVHTTMAS